MALSRLVNKNLSAVSWSVHQLAGPSAGQSITSWSVHQLVSQLGPSGPISTVNQSVRSQSLRSGRQLALCASPGYIYVLAARHAQRRDVCGVDSAAQSTDARGRFGQAGGACTGRHSIQAPAGRTGCCAERSDSGRWWECKPQEERTGPHQDIKTVYPGQSEMILQDKLFFFHLRFSSLPC